MIKKIISFDELNYIQNTPGFSSFSDEKIICVERFMLFWSRFEDKYSNRDFKLKDFYENKIPKIVTFFKDDKHNNNLRDVLKYFQKFFKDGNNIPHRIYGSDEKDIHKEGIIYIKDIELSFKLKDEDIKNSCYFLTFFVYRLRNNLFHGIKQIEELEQQNQLFNFANYYLSILLDAYETI